MKILFSIIISSFLLLQSAWGQSIVGKWYCTNAFLDSLGQAEYFDDLNGNPQGRSPPANDWYWAWIP